MIYNWVGPVFPLNFIYDIGNFSVLLLILCIILKKKKILNKLSFCKVFILLSTPFLFNNFFVDPSLFPDQSKYTFGAKFARENLNYEFLFHDFKVFVANIIYSVSPVLSFETYKTIGFINRFLFILVLLLFITEKKIDNLSLIILIFSPSITLYTSIALRDILSALSLILCFYYWLNKRNFFLSLFLFFLAIMLKYQNLIFFVIMIFSYFAINYREKIITYLIILFFCVIIFYFSTEIIEISNNYRKGLFLEEYGAYKASGTLIFYNEISFNLKFLSSLPSLYLKFIFSPFEVGSIKKIILCLESIVILSFILFQIFKLYKKNREIFFVTIFNFLITTFIYSIFIYNSGTSHRYKTMLYFTFLFLISILNNNYKKLNENTLFNIKS